MNTFIKTIKKLYWLGFLGLAGTFLHLPRLKLFYLFFLLAIIDFVLSFAIVLKTETRNESVNSLKFLFQNIGILLGIPFIYLRNLFRLPNIQNYEPEVLYQLPFEGCWTVANGGITRETSHSWGVCSQRYAYDFYIQENGRTFHSDGKNVTDYFCYGKPILAPADGTVVEIKNRFDDTPLPEKIEAVCSASDVRGNYIVLRHSGHEYSTIAHIKKDSFCVSVVENVRRGQLLACCGNSGNTSEPHIHFQVQQGKSFLFSASLPIHFTKITKHTGSSANSCLNTGDIAENLN